MNEEPLTQNEYMLFVVPSIKRKLAKTQTTKQPANPLSISPLNSNHLRHFDQNFRKREPMSIFTDHFYAEVEEVDESASERSKALTMDDNTLTP